jgi:glycerol-3-phosphate acyltransferase PlsX
MTIKVSIDASGGDHGIPITVVAGIKALNVFPNLQLVFVGDKRSIQTELTR